MLGDSPDGMCGFTTKFGIADCAAVELKTMTALKTIEKAKTTRDQTSTLIVIEDIGVSPAADKVFREVVPTSEYRLQCLQHATVLQVGTVFFTVAKGGTAAKGEIFYVACLKFSPMIRRFYTFCLNTIRKTAFNWIGEPASSIPIEYESIVKDCHAYAIYSFSSYYSLSLAMKNSVEKNQAPLPPARMIRPTALVYWNALKGGVDEFSRTMKTLSRCNVSETPLKASLAE